MRRNVKFVSMFWNKSSTPDDLQRDTELMVAKEIVVSRQMPGKKRASPHGNINTAGDRQKSQLEGRSSEYARLLSFRIPTRR